MDRERTVPDEALPEDHPLCECVRAVVLVLYDRGQQSQHGLGVRVRLFGGHDRTVQDYVQQPHVAGARGNITGIEVGVQASASTARVGQTVVYTYQVTNSGQAVLDPVAAGDNRLGAVTLSSTALSPGQTAHGTLTHTVGLSDLPGPLLNTATASGSPPVGSPVTATAAAVLSLIRDLDGVEDAVEDGAPNGGDGNGDGVPDKDQDEVTSLPGAGSGAYFTLVSPEGTVLTEVDAMPPPEGGPEGVELNHGCLAFCVTGLTPGASITVTVVVHDSWTADGYWKYGPTPHQPVVHWYPFLWDGSTGAVIDGSEVVLHLTDGQRGDADLVADGEIVEPGGPVGWERSHIYLPLTLRSGAP